MIPPDQPRGGVTPSRPALSGGEKSPSCPEFPCSRRLLADRPGLTMTLSWSSHWYCTALLDTRAWAGRAAARVVERSIRNRGQNLGWARRTRSGRGEWTNSASRFITPSPSLAAVEPRERMRRCEIVSGQERMVTSLWLSNSQPGLRNSRSAGSEQDLGGRVKVKGCSSLVQRYLASWSCSASWREWRYW